MVSILGPPSVDLMVWSHNEGVVLGLPPFLLLGVDLCQLDPDLQAARRTYLLSYRIRIERLCLTCKSELLIMLTSYPMHAVLGMLNVISF